MEPSWSTDMAGEMSKEELNTVLFGMQAIAEKAGFVGFSCSFLYSNRENRESLHAGGFAYLPKLPNNEEDTRKAFREMREALDSAGEDVLLQVYERQIEAAVLAAANTAVATDDAAPVEVAPPAELPVEQPAEA